MTARPSTAAAKATAAAEEFPTIQAWEPRAGRLEFGLPRLGIGTSSHSYYPGGLFAPATTQRHVYERVGKPLVDSIWDGTDAACLVYGQTGSGKTHTLHGTAAAPSPWVAAVATAREPRNARSPQHMPPRQHMRQPMAF